MDAAHRAALLAVSCIHTPVNPRTKVPIALYEREPEKPRAGAGDRQVGLWPPLALPPVGGCLPPRGCERG
uniref:Uncharacterized protein n=1 Tax=Varanus komodoensis TaxID=61221 RepID=A0A8D2JFY1_VARKO